VFDPFFLFFAAAILAASAFVIPIVAGKTEAGEVQRGEHYALMLFAIFGMLLLASGNDLVVLFLAQETIALCFYISVGFLRQERQSMEAAVKYVVMGGLSSAILAYGFSILYGLAGSTNLSEIAQKVAGFQDRAPSGNSLAFVALATIGAALLLKVAAVPFHQWAPDVLEGAPTTVSAFLGATAKLASFAIFLRIFLLAFWPMRFYWLPVIEIVAIFSLVLGTLAALTQSSVKRLLAYSAIAQSGYLLMGLVASAGKGDAINPPGWQATGFYVLVFAFLNAGAFAILAILQSKEKFAGDLDDLRGLRQRSPAAAVLMLIFLLSLAGLPPTAGFIAKIMILGALLETRHFALAILAALSFPPTVYYYFRLVAAMWARESGDPARPLITLTQRVALCATSAGAIVAGIFPEHLLRFVSYCVPSAFLH
jgi:NADH-quinone oxidoreductase subunit N